MVQNSYIIVIHGMRRVILLTVAFIATALVFREAGVIHFSSFRQSEESTISVETDVPMLNVSKVVFEQDTDNPYLPSIKAPDDFYQVTVRYRISKSLSPWRWIPLYKFGSNQVQVTYMVWMENGLVGCGSIHLTGKQKLFGMASARDYELALTKPLIEKMKGALRPKLVLMRKQTEEVAGSR